MKRYVLICALTLIACFAVIAIWLVFTGTKKDCYGLAASPLIDTIALPSRPVCCIGSARGILVAFYDKSLILYSPDLARIISSVKLNEYATSLLETNDGYYIVGSSDGHIEIHDANLSVIHKCNYNESKTDIQAIFTIGNYIYAINTDCDIFKLSMSLCVVSKTRCISDSKSHRFISACLRNDGAVIATESGIKRLTIQNDNILIDDMGLSDVYATVAAIRPDSVLVSQGKTIMKEIREQWTSVASLRFLPSRSIASSSGDSVVFYGSNNVSIYFIDYTEGGNIKLSHTYSSYTERNIKSIVIVDGHIYILHDAYTYNDRAADPQLVRYYGCVRRCYRTE
ncbi:MAG: hypothetical protein U0796_18975 [Gemmatales bacterium]